MLQKKGFVHIHAQHKALCQVEKYYFFTELGRKYLLKSTFSERKCVTICV